MLNYKSKICTKSTWEDLPKKSDEKEYGISKEINDAPCISLLPNLSKDSMQSQSKAQQVWYWQTDSKILRKDKRPRKKIILNEKNIVKH